MSEYEHLDGLPVYDPKARHAPAKAGLPAPLAKKARAKARRSQEADFLNEVWARDQGRCRATGKPLTKELNRLRKVACVRAPEFRLFDYTGPDNRALPQHFVWRDADGRITKETVG